MQTKVYIFSQYKWQNISSTPLLYYTLRKFASKALLEPQLSLHMSCKSLQVFISNKSDFNYIISAGEGVLISQLNVLVRNKIYPLVHGTGLQK